MTTQNVLALVLGGGRGSRLWPLTKLRAKPAVPIGGKYRLIDIPVSNCLNSDIHQIAILTQFNSVSLHRHISRTYQFDSFHPGWVQILAAEQTLTSADWYQGTADAVRKQLFEIQVTGATEVLILAGDHLYRMDYDEMVRNHRDVGADVTVGVRPVRRQDASRFGILRQDAENRITAFVEKPKTDEALKGFALEGEEELYPGSMGIYLFRTEVLIDLLNSDLDDFGSDVIPAAIQSHKVYACSFGGYWADIGTMRAFYEANLLLTQPDSPFRFHDPVRPIYTHPRFLPGSRIYDVRLDRVLLADGCVVEGADLQHSVIGIRSVIGEDVIIRDTVIMGADYYEEEASELGEKPVPMGIGRGSRISGAIIDKNARIGEGVRIEPFPRGTEMDEADWSVRDGIVVVPKSAVIPSGMVIAP
ncbi:MAG: glucose-1-phosphate adenylyltransferase [Chloroflexi bacterium RBG_19FT_COMBO_62_14]|nr:MAG: glucose-1-phosphate adenylyltransferase [Chloroflexi bacterium RBG_19FT_COMBO_62_14]